MASSIKAVVTNTTPASLIFYFDEVDHSSEGTVLEVSSTGYNRTGTAPWCAYSFTSVSFDSSCTSWMPTSLINFFSFTTSDYNTSITSIDCTNLNTSNVTNMINMFWNLRGVTNISLRGCDTSHVVNMDSMFNSCIELETLDIPISTSSVTSMAGMFSNCSNTDLVLNLNTFDTSSVTNMVSMFTSYKGSVIYIGSGWDVTKVTMSTSMFLDATNLPGYDSTKTNVSMAKPVTEGGYLTFGLPPEPKHFFFNNNYPLAINYNNQVVREVYYNNVKVWDRVRLPEEYQEIEYLGSTGTQYIDTGRVPNATDIIEQKFRRNDTSNDVCAWYGSMPANNVVTPRIGIGVASSGWFAGVNSTNYFLGDIDTNTHTIKFWYSTNKRMNYILDGGVEQIIGQANSIEDVQLSLTSYLFARHGSSGVQVSDGGGTNIYYHKEYLADGTLVLDLIPCYRKSDGVPGMYDTISNTFLTNQGTDEFIVGPLSNSIIPDGYQEVRYIEGTGTQYIDTGIKPTANMKWVLVNQFVGTPSNPYYYNGLYDGSDGSVRRVDIGLTNSYLYLNFGDSNSVTSMGNIVDNKFTFTIDAKNMTWAYDETTGSLPATSDKTSDLNIYLFTRNENGTANRFCNQKTYSSKIYENDVLVQNLVPCYRKSDNKPGMYDTVTNTFLTNQGTDEFVTGPAINSVIPDAYQEVRYIQNDGTEYLDLGITTSRNTKIHIVWEDDAATGSNYVTGSRAGVNDTIVQGLTGGTATMVVQFSGTNVTTGNNYRVAGYKYECEFNFKESIDGTGYIKNLTNGDEFTGSQISSVEPQANICVFAVRSGMVQKGMKLYSYKLYDNNVLVRDLIPCYRKADSVVGAYDLVNDVFYTNAGSGRFIAGPDIDEPVSGLTGFFLGNPNSNSSEESEESEEIPENNDIIEE